MERKTRDHTEVALRNLELANWIARPASDRPDQANAWGTVAAFYSAVHIVNAYMWESQRVEPKNHHLRGRFVDRDPLLQTVRSDFRNLVSLGWSARYDPDARISFTDL